MKKFFSLVLALVMALSLTTVAWGADVNYTVGAAGDYGTLEAAVAAVNPGDNATITLLEDVALSSRLYVTTDATITIYGDGNTITSTVVDDETIMLGNSASTTATHKYTLKNIVFDQVATSNVVDVIGASASIIGCTFQNCTTAGAMIQASNGAEVTVSGCAFDLNSCAQAIYFQEDAGNFVVENCVFTENDASQLVYFKGNATFSATGNTFTDNEIAASGNGAVIYADGVTATGNTFTGNEVATTGRAGVVVADMGTVSGNVFSGNDVDGAADKTATVVAKGDPATTLDVSGNYWDGTAPDVANDGDGDVTAATYYTTATGGVLSGLTSNVPATNNLTKYTLWGAKVAATAAGVNYIATDLSMPIPSTAVAPTATALYGTVSYYTVLGDKYVVGTADDCDVYFTVKGKTAPVMYLKQINQPTYHAVATEFAAFGDGCGQIPVKYKAADTKYYTYTDLDDNTIVFAGSADKLAVATDVVLVNNKLVPVVPYDIYDTYANEHSWTFTFDTVTAKPVSAKCEECGATAKVYTTYTAIPKGADFIREGAYFLVIDVPVATDKVESADTFDAGIAMYVGMSVMAAAGSAVVIGKKKD